jgi:predicted protein tyrosine phosphatase
MYTVSNITRIAAQEYVVGENKNLAWISIQEPGQEPIVSQLDEYPNLKISFWDVVAPLTSITDDYVFNPPNEKDAQAIFDFIRENRHRNLIVNCKMGISRSAAISKFCADCLGYYWVVGRTHMFRGLSQPAKPNLLLYDLLFGCYRKYHGKLLNERD